MTDSSDAKSPPTLMLSETREAPDVVARLIAENEATCSELGKRLRDRPPLFAVTCARGSSDSAATYAKYLLELHLDTVVASVGPSVASIYGRRPRMRDALFVAISQSGKSPDLVTLAETAGDDGALRVAIVNDTASPLAERCEIVLPLHAGPEKSVAATKSYIASLAAVLQLGAHWSGDAALLEAVRRLADVLHDALSRDWQAALPILAETRSLYVVGRGPGFAIAQEAALKLKETCGLHAEALSAAEMKHGPRRLAGPDFPVMLFSQDDDALPELTGTGTGLTAEDVPVIACGPVALPGALTLAGAGGIHPFAQPLATIQSFYPLAEAVSRARGFDPDRPPHLSKVTETR
ncbi:MAG: SIS domain-containing protein [Bauldia sp.]|nr:SIS domain-containing protein [Bauldia sp.]